MSGWERTKSVLSYLNHIKGVLTLITFFVGGLVWATNAFVMPAIDRYVEGKATVLVSEQIGTMNKLLEEQSIRTQNMNSEMNKAASDRELLRLQFETLQKMLREADERNERMMREMRGYIMNRPPQPLLE